MIVSQSYRRGIRIVLYTILASAIVTLAWSRSGSSPPRAAWDLGDQGERLGSFELVERSGRSVTDADLADRVWIASFIFTRCPLSCPRISSVMKGLQERLSGTRVLLVSISVDPDHDTPAILADYAMRFGAVPDRWWFLTGSRSSIYELIERRFKLTVMPNPSPDPEGKGEQILHSDRLALVDHGRVIGLFESSDNLAIDTLVASAKRRALPNWVKSLSAVNASLNAVCAFLLVLGWRLIRGRSRPIGGSKVASYDHDAQTPLPSSSILKGAPVLGHVACMSLAVFTSAVFLGCYLVYHSQALSVPFQGQGPVRVVYLTILLSHTLLATFGVVPLVVLTLIRALRGDYARHMSIAAVTFPIWLYVSVTGVVIYLMLYQMPGSSGSLLSAV